MAMANVQIMHVMQININNPQTNKASLFCFWSEHTCKRIWQKYFCTQVAFTLESLNQSSCFLLHCVNLIQLVLLFTLQLCQQNFLRDESPPCYSTVVVVLQTQCGYSPFSYFNFNSNSSSSNVLRGSFFPILVSCYDYSLLSLPVFDPKVWKLLSHET